MDNIYLPEYRTVALKGLLYPAHNKAPGWSFFC